MKIAILHTSLDVQGGAERQVLMLANGLQQKGHDVTVYVSKLDRENCYPDLVDKVNIIECGGFGYKDIKKTILFSLHYMKKMAEKIEDCDIIHCHNYPTTYAAVKAKKKFGKPIIWMCNEPPFPPLYKGAKKSRSLYSLIYKKLVYGFLIYNKIVVKKIDKIIVLDEMNKQRVNLTYKNKDVQIVHTGLDFPNNIAADNGNDNVERDKFTILCTGRIDKGKRTEDAIRSMVDLRKKVPNIRMDIVGSGKTLEDMKKLSVKLGLEQEIVFHGRVSDEKLSELYSTCDIFLFTAENQSWGLVPLEAMAHGKPCIVSTGAGVSGVLEEGKVCLKINPRDVVGIVKNVLLLYNDKEFADKIAKNGKEFVKKEFSWDNYVNKMEKVFLDYYNQ